MLGILGRKIGMTQIFDENGLQIPVTVVEAGPAVVTQIKNVESDGYNAIQLSFGEKKQKNTTKPLQGHFEKAGTDPKKYVVEFSVDDVNEFKLGQEIKADIFTEGELVDVTGTSKGKGTAGAIKRWNYSRGPETHGSKYHRAAGSRGASATPSRVIKGMKGPGRMGYEKVTVQNLQVVRVDVDRSLLLIKGALPGPKKGFITVKPAVKVSK